MTPMAHHLLNNFSSQRSEETGRKMSQVLFDSLLALAIWRRIWPLVLFQQRHILLEAKLSIHIRAPSPNLTSVYNNGEVTR